MSENESSTQQATEVAVPGTALTATPAAPVTVKLTRRVYGAHKVYGTCITVGAFVFIPSVTTAAKFDKKSAARLEFSVTGTGAEAMVLDPEGEQWICAGENGGCGPRLSALPVEARAAFKASWHSMPFAERIAVIRELVPAKDAAPAAAAE